MIYKPVPYIIGDIVAKVREGYSELGIEPYYEYGTALEVVNTLSLKAESVEFEDKRYPLIWFLVKDSLKQEVKYNRATPRIAKDLTIIFCTITSAEYRAADRFANTFIPILRPLYDLFVHYLKLSNEVRSITHFSHNYYENMFWGRDGLYGHEGNIFNDRLDAIIVDNLDLHLIEKC